MFAPASTAWRRIAIDASAVVTTPVTIVAASPALSVSTVSVFQSTPMPFLIRSTMSPAETAGAACVERARTSGAATVAAVSAANCLRVRSVMLRIPSLMPQSTSAAAQSLHARGPER